jgi:hypothetical protein
MVATGRVLFEESVADDLIRDLSQQYYVPQYGSCRIGSRPGQIADA